MRSQSGYDSWKTTPDEEDDREFCTYPNCDCPYDRINNKPCYAGLEVENAETDD